MSFRGNTDNNDRNNVQSLLSKNIGNESTHARSVELAIRCELKLFQQMGKRSDKIYKEKCDLLIKELSDPKNGFELNRKLLCGELSPEKWVLEKVPDKRPELMTNKKTEEKKSNNPTPALTKVKPTTINTTTNINDKLTEKDKHDDSAVSKSSYYFFKSTPKEEAHRYAPKPLDEKVLPHVESAHAPNQDGLSAWNKGGTWEDRDMSSWAKEHFKKHLQNIEINEVPNGQVKIHNSWTVTGEASIIYVRGKKKCGYELSANTKFEGEFEGQSVKGSIKIPTIDETEGSCGDFNVKITCDNNSDASKIIKLCVLKSVDTIKKRIENFHHAFKEA